MRMGKAADAHDAGVLGRECVRPKQMMLGSGAGMRKGTTPDTHDSGVVGPDCRGARQLMLIMGACEDSR